MSQKIPGSNVIAVDFDDVTVGFNEAFSEYNRTLYGSRVRHEDIITFDMATVYGISKPVLMSRVRDFCHNHHYEIKPNDDVIRALRELKEMGKDLQIVTNRCESLRDITLGYIDIKAPGLFSAVHFANGFTLLNVEKMQTKLAICLKIDASLLIDDALSNAIDVTSGGIPVLLLNQPWNQEPEPEGATRIYHGHEIVSWVEKNLP